MLATLTFFAVNLDALPRVRLMKLSGHLRGPSFISTRNSFPDPIKRAALIIGISRGNSLISLAPALLRESIPTRKKER